MSKAKKHQLPKQQQARPAWLLPAIGAGIVILLTALVALISANRGTPYEPEVVGAPSAEFDVTSIDHGSVRYDQPVESVFRVRNVGDKPLIIQGEPRVELVEGC